MGIAAGLLLAPIALLFSWGCGLLVWAQAVAAWHSGAIPVALGCTAFGVALLAWPKRTR